MDIDQFYLRHYKKFFVVPIIVILAAFSILLFNYINTGSIMEMDVTLKGGISTLVYTEASNDGLQEFLSQKFVKGDVSVRSLKEFGSEKQTGIIIEATGIEEEELKNALQEFFGFELNEENYSSEEVSPSLGGSFYRQMLVAMILAFMFMGIAVFITFRTFIPSLTVIFAAFADIVIGMAVWSLMGGKLSTAIIAALLLLLGYSIDTDILLTTRMLKHAEGELIKRFFSSVKTGCTMTITTLAALSVGYAFITSDVLRNMFLVIIIGLVADIVITYLFNGGVLFIYTRKKQGALQK